MTPEPTLFDSHVILVTLTISTHMGHASRVFCSHRLFGIRVKLILCWLGKDQRISHTTVELECICLCKNVRPICRRKVLKRQKEVTKICSRNFGIRSVTVTNIRDISGEFGSDIFCIRLGSRQSLHGSSFLVSFFREWAALINWLLCFCFVECELFIFIISFEDQCCETKYLTKSNKL